MQGTINLRQKLITLPSFCTIFCIGFASLISAHTNQLDGPLLDTQSIVEESCKQCHNDAILIGNMSLDNFTVDKAVENATISEKMIRKLRAGMMPPPGAPRPSEEALDRLASELETKLDENATHEPIPGGRTFQRLNRTEYENAIQDLLGIKVDAGAFLPLDTKSANFDNIADVQMLSATLMEGYLRAASAVTRLVIGDKNATPRETTYKVPRWGSQTEQVDGAPYGTRGGVSQVHFFPADGEYTFRVSFHHETTGQLHGSAPAALHTIENPEQIEISINGEQKAIFNIDRWMHASDPNGVNIRTDPLFVRSGHHRVTAAFIRKLEGPVQDLIAPHDWSIASTSIADMYGMTSLPHLRDLAITGPYNVSGVSEMPERHATFTCNPKSVAEEVPCAKEIISQLATKAYRRPLASDELQALLDLYETGFADEGFDSGVRTALEGILASPNFVFRFEKPPENQNPNKKTYRLNDIDLASRLSFFLWGTIPDQELLVIAESGELSNPKVLEKQARRLLEDPRATALSSRFAGQWLRLQDLNRMHPNVRTYPNFHDQLKESMRRETELFFENLVREDRNILELLTADYTFIDERLATHYRISGVRGNNFRRVQYDGGTERTGLLGHGSILTLTSHASRTSPVLRGKWIMEVFLGSPPPPPPPGIPELEDAGESTEGRLLSVREQMELHRADPGCNSCHQTIDPLGLALENFDATGAWRIRDRDVVVDATGELYDGTALTGPSDLRDALLNRSASFIRTFTENLMAYGIGRRMEYYDMPAIRRIERDAILNENRLSSFILGVVRSAAFQMKTVAPRMSNSQ